MNEGLATARDDRTADKRHVDLLSIFHFIGAGLALLGIGFLILHYAMFNSVFSNEAIWKNQPAPPPRELFDALRWVYLVAGLWYGLSLVLNLLAALYLPRLQHRTFCFVVAAFNCLHIPLGTVLGIFTIIVLARDSVRAAFEARPYSVDPLG
jgi:hypothetical protein